MTHTDEPTFDEVWAVALEVCSDRQLEVIRWRYRGASWRQIATVLGLTHTTVRDHFQAGCDRIIVELDRRQPGTSDADATLEPLRAPAGPHAQQ